MAASFMPANLVLPELPVEHDQFIHYLATHKDEPILPMLDPFNRYDAGMRRLFAQHPEHPAVTQPNIVPVFAGYESEVRIRARNLAGESVKEKQSFIMPLKDEDRRGNATPAIVQSLKAFRTNFNVFSESSLVDLDWSNVVVAGSAVVTSLLAVPSEHSQSKRALRSYYHEKVAPASDVDLFLYGLTEHQAIEKIKQIERNVRDAILVETTTVRTKNTVVIASKYPTRHVQIVLRIYRSISEILTGFDVDCSCAAYDGKQVYASPRALAAYMTQINTVDLTRRSPSYENRLSKYARRGFEVYWPGLDRSRIDPTIFERSFRRTEGLARLLVLEKLPKSSDREEYLDQRRAERGRPAVDRTRLNTHQMHGDIKAEHEDEVADWIQDDEISDYHTCIIPYGERFNARKIERILYAKDLLLNAEWNAHVNERDVYLHRHPAFFGSASDALGDCCGHCPQPQTIEEEETAENDSKIYVSGPVKFIKDDPGRQAIGSFNPLTSEDWTEMAYVSNTGALCQAIIDNDAEYVRRWLHEEENNPNSRDWTGRTPLHLAVCNSTPEIVQLLIDNGARLVARLADGRTSLHLAATRGEVAMVSALMRKSEANEEAEAKKLEIRRAARGVAKHPDGVDVPMRDSSIEPKKRSSYPDEQDSESEIDMADHSAMDIDTTTEGSMVKIKSPERQAEDGTQALEDNDEPDVFDVNVLAWDTAASPLHLAIINGHIDVVRCLVQEFGADILLPIKIPHGKAILSLVLALQLPQEQAETMVRNLVDLGASVAQADANQNTALQFAIAERPEMVQVFLSVDKTGTRRAVNHLGFSFQRPILRSPLLTAIRAKDSLTALLLLENGAVPSISFAAYMKACQSKHEFRENSKENKKVFEKQVEQPVISAVCQELPRVVRHLLENHMVDPNTLSTSAYDVIHTEYLRSYMTGSSLLDEVRAKIKELREWTPSGQERLEEPTPPAEVSEYLAGFKAGSYQFWSAQKQVAEAKADYERQCKEYKESLTRTSSDQAGIPEKQAVIDDMVAQFEEVESLLAQRGAKTFQELYPYIGDGEKRERNHKSEKPTPFQVEFTFHLPDLTDEAQDKYVKLFEAAWSGDLSAVKALTLIPWEDQEGDKHPPLKIAVRDQHHLSPFSITVLSGQLELASTIAEICAAQIGTIDPERQLRYGISGDLSDSGEDEDDDFRLESELVDEDYTVETVGEVSLHAKGLTSPLTMLLWDAPVDDFLGGPLRSSPSISSGFSYFGPRRSPHTLMRKRTNSGSLKAARSHISDDKRKDMGPPTNLIQFALYTDDFDLLNFLLSLGEQYTRATIEEGDEDAQRFFSAGEDDFRYALKLDRPHLVAEFIRRSCAGVPLDQLLRQCDIEYKEKPKYYQGLSVYGRKRKDWADAGRNLTSRPASESRPPLLEAAHYSSLDTVEWFLTDGPLRKYKEFAEANRDDKRIKLLAEAKGGFEGAVSRFLQMRANLAIHSCLRGKPVPETIKVLNFLINALPESVNHKSVTGSTPLAIAFRCYRAEAAKLIIKASADQTCRDKHGNNLLHNLLKHGVTTEKQLRTLTSMIELIDERLLPSMFLEKCSDHPGSLTPLAQWVTACVNESSCSRFSNEVLQKILSYSKGRELNSINGEGLAPVHVAVREGNFAMTQTLLNWDPALSLRENTTGRTPYEMAQDSVIHDVCSGPPPLPDDPEFAERRAHKHCWPWGLVLQDAMHFIETSEKDGRSEREKVLDLLKETQSKLQVQGHAKRQLVTLNEANEVALRLATKKSRQQDAKAHEDDGDGGRDPTH